MFTVWCGRLEVGGVPSHLASRGTEAAKYPSHQSNPPIRGSPMHGGLFPSPRRKTVSGMDKQDWKNGIGGCCVQTLGVHWCRNDIFLGHGTQNKHTEQLQPRSPPPSFRGHFAGQSKFSAHSKRVLSSQENISNRP